MITVARRNDGNNGIRIALGDGAGDLESGCHAILREDTQNTPYRCIEALFSLLNGAFGGQR